MELSLRKATRATADGTPAAGTAAYSTTTAAGSGQQSTGTGPPDQTPSGKAKGPEYYRYRLDVPNRSLVDPDMRRTLANLLQAVLDAVDPDTGGDIQLVDLQLNLTADSAAVEEIEQRANAIGATWSTEALDF